LTANRGRFPSPTYILPLPEGGGGLGKDPLCSLPLEKREDPFHILPLRKRRGLPPPNPPPPSGRGRITGGGGISRFTLHASRFNLEFEFWVFVLHFMESEAGLSFF